MDDPVYDKKKLKKDVVTDSEEAEESKEGVSAQYIRQVNPAAEYMAMHPRFSRDFKKLAYVGRDESFLTHSGNYQLK
jgi:hypothetical protein